jgi:signal transduction histidine kinase
MKKDYIGKIITLYNITEYKKLVIEVETKNHELKLANIQLKEHANAVKELAVARERNRLAGDVHDSVGHTMTVLISLIGVCSIACDKDIGTVKQKLNEMMDAALKGHSQLKNRFKV